MNKRSQDIEEVCAGFHGTILEFITDLRNNVLTKIEEQTLLDAVRIKFEKENSQKVLKNFTKRALPHIAQIQSRDDKYFLANMNIFLEIPAKHLDYFTKVWNDKKRMTPDNMDVCWNYLITMITLAETYSVLVKETL